MVQSLTNYVVSMPDELGIMLLSMIPVTELRAAIPIYIARGMEPLLAFILAIIGNILPVPFILFLSRPIFKWMRSRRCFTGVVGMLEKRVNKNKEKVLRYQFWGLALFVAIPLPGTGAWTGAFIASILDLRFKSAFPSVTIGVIIAGAIITTSGAIIKALSSAILVWMNFLF